jgi:gliding motility-associated-like protein
MAEVIKPIKFFLLTLIFISRICDLSAQEFYYKEFPEQKHPFGWGCSPLITPTKNEGWIILSSHCNQSKQFVQKYDKCGNILWSKSFQGPHEIIKVKELKNGDILIAGIHSRDIIIRLDANGNFIHSKSFNCSNIYGPKLKSFVEIDEDLYLLWSGILLKYKNDQVEWAIRITDGWYSEIIADDKDLIITSEMGAKFFKINSNGVFLWAKKIVNHYGSSTVKVENGFLYSCYKNSYYDSVRTEFIVKVDFNGSIQWVTNSFIQYQVTDINRYPPWSPNINSISNSNDFSFFTVGTTSERRIIIMKFDSLGSLLNNVCFYPGEHAYMGKDIIWRNGSVVITGLINKADDYYLSLLKTDFKNPDCIVDYEIEILPPPIIDIENYSPYKFDLFCEVEDFLINIEDYLPMEETICYSYIMPALKLGDTLVCNQIILENSEPEFQSYHWSTGSIEKSITVENSGTYTLTAVTCAGDTLSASVNVEVVKTPVIEVEDDYKICLTDSLYVNAAIPGAHVYWQETGTPDITFKYSGVYTLVAENQCGRIEKSTNVEVEECFVVPNVFTPNNDGVNDFFAISGFGIKEVQGEIYNRWGQKLTDFSSYWDGGDAVEGVYFFNARITLTDNEVLNRKGFVTLMR